jgi:hypothetical protein
LCGFVASAAVFLFCVYVAFTLCGYCLTNPNALSPGRLPWETVSSDYWNMDGLYAFYAFLGILAFFLLYTASLFKTAYLAFVILVAYEISLILFDYRNLGSHATNFQLDYPLISWITNKDLLLMGSGCGSFLEIARRIFNYRAFRSKPHGAVD